MPARKRTCQHAASQVASQPRMHAQPAVVAPGATHRKGMLWMRRRLGISPEQISCSSTPNEKMSALLVQRSSVSTSGAVYASVPPTARVCVSA